ncbi:ribosomal-processing cysteine protease Prp [Acetanaerobacterium elongatum]|uniref:Ribosomal processing cysteine protease Prp n=1 Tax=Acetanaerobacterium elongatum TaxID=258515 RepID=A0A1H0B4B4_9FIRM|nr:ribosomal-processing cysteine protease Prp [Acetanaerobacterium elongatum]SDN40527.1 hypothetical protein SAMN05192585_11852 [Acetanaerobacterium elongatum]
MIRAGFVKANGRFKSFVVSGHAGYAESGSDIVCAAVSSAVQLTANAVTEVAGIKAKVQVNEDNIALTLPNGCESDAAELLIAALYLHLSLLAEDYNDAIQVLTEE